MIRWSDLVTLAREHHVYPARCAHCRSRTRRTGNWSEPTTDDCYANHVMWQCYWCGRYTGRDREGLLAMLRRQRDAEVTR